jgi:hydroxymethylpyrimidine/phosphomethylpyrimidine kinase
MKNVYRALTIAGSDSGGGAGIQADLKTFMARGVFGMSAITAVTAQNTLGVQGIHAIPNEIIAKQIDMVIEDIGIDAVKTGMLGTAEVIELVVEKLKEHKVGVLVVDPVMIAKGGARLLQQDAVNSMIHKLLPIASIITPNIPEAEVLTGKSIKSLAEMESAARQLVAMGAKAAVVKGGHSEGEPVDVFYDGTEMVFLEGKRFETKHTHGTGCTFSACIAAELAKGKSMAESVRVAKLFITAAISDVLGLGSGHGPTNHWAYKGD